MEQSTIAQHGAGSLEEEKGGEVVDEGEEEEEEKEVVDEGKGEEEVVVVTDEGEEDEGLKG